MGAGRKLTCARNDAKGMMGLRDVGIMGEYSSGRDSILRDFYVPCLREAVAYDRAVGYFTSASLRLAADGIGAFLARGGSIRLVASPVLSEQDADAIIKGYRARNDVVEEALALALDPARMPDPERQALAFLSWLIEQGRLEIKLALVDLGIYHAKFGVLSDPSGDFVAFSGSANESYGGLVANYETIDVYRSWEEADRSRASSKREQFEVLWDGRDPVASVVGFPGAAERLITQTFQPKRPPEDGINDGGGPARLVFPSTRKVRRIQDEATAAWFAADGRGIWSIATGGGKTIGALLAAARLGEIHQMHERPLVIVVLVPYLNLARQWVDEITAFGVRATMCSSENGGWRDELSREVISLRSAPRTLVIVATYDTMTTDAFQAQLTDLGSNMLVIADEMHHAGARSRLALLPQDARYRLGLSATPERHRDEGGTAGLRAYFGDVVYELTIDEAIERGILCPYEYFPIPIELTDDEMDAYIELTGQISKRIGMSGVDALDTPGADPGLDALLAKRARLLGGAQQKLAALRKALLPLRDETHILIYCSDGRVGVDDPDGPGERQIDAVLQLVGNGIGMRANSYTYETSPKDRRSLEASFASGSLQALVAIRCLDEGMDIPATHLGFVLASSTNPRQYIQRRGRLLRHSEETGKTHAEIYDFVVVPPGALAGAPVDPELFEVERRLVERELVRVAEFARVATNAGSALRETLALRDRYQLLDVGW